MYCALGMLGPCQKVSLSPATWAWHERMLDELLTQSDAHRSPPPRRSCCHSHDASAANPRMQVVIMIKVMTRAYAHTSDARANTLYGKLVLWHRRMTDPTMLMSAKTANGTTFNRLRVEALNDAVQTGTRGAPAVNIVFECSCGASVPLKGGPWIAATMSQDMQVVVLSRYSVHVWHHDADGENKLGPTRPMQKQHTSARMTMHKEAGLRRYLSIPRGGKRHRCVALQHKAREILHAGVEC